MRRALGRAARIILAVLLGLAGLFLGWELVANAPTWSNGWAEGASYALGAAALLAMASLLAAGRTESPWLFWSLGLALAIPGLWCLRWMLWLLIEARTVGPVALVVPLAFGLVGLLLLIAAWALARRGWQAVRS